MNEQEEIARQLIQDTAREAREAGVDVTQTHPCPWCGQPVVWDPENWFAEKIRHEKDCPQVKEWERCKE